MGGVALYRRGFAAELFYEKSSTHVCDCSCGRKKKITRPSRLRVKRRRERRGSRRKAQTAAACTCWRKARVQKADLSYRGSRYSSSQGISRRCLLLYRRARNRARLACFRLLVRRRVARLVFVA